MGIYPFKEIHLMPVWADGIGFPPLFYPAIYETRTVVLTRKGAGLFGYTSGVWEGLKESLGSRYKTIDAAPEMIRCFLESARTCPVQLGDRSYGKVTYTGDVDDELAFWRDPAYELKVPRGMIEQAGFGQEAIVVGMGYHFEIWPPADWEKRKYRPPYRTISRGMYYPNIDA